MEGRTGVIEENEKRLTGCSQTSNKLADLVPQPDNLKYLPNLRFLIHIYHVPVKEREDVPKPNFGVAGN